MSKGWYGDRMSHSLASRGIKSKQDTRNMFCGYNVEDVDEIYSFGSYLGDVKKSKMGLFTGDKYDEIEMWESKNGVIYYIGRNYKEGESIILDYDYPVILKRKASGVKKSTTAKNFNKGVKNLEKDASETADDVNKSMKKVDNLIDKSASKTAKYIKKWGKEIDDSASETAKYIRNIFEVKK